MASTPTQLTIATLYAAAFNRAPDAAGFDFWLQAHEQGVGLANLAGTFLSAPEGLATYPAGLSSQEFVAAFYSSVFGRAADAGGLAFWTAALDSLGGATNTAAKAALMVRIIDVATTPLGSKPADLSDAAYAQTVADRARFANKAEAGVYFAAELRSNDLALAKQMFAMITDDPASLIAARNYVDSIINPPPVVVPPVVVPPPVLTSADDAPTITNKLNSYSGTAATADTTGMDAAQLKALAAGVSKFVAGALTGAMALDSTVTINEATDLLAKYAGTTASANAAGMDSDYLVLLASSSKFAAASIAAPTLVLGNATLDDTMTETLLGKATGAQIDATGATADELLSIINHIGNVAAGGISGNFALLGSLTATQLTALFGKFDTGASVTADVSAMGADQLAVLAAHPSAMGIGALTGALHLSDSLDATEVELLLNRYDGTDASLTASATVGSDVLNVVVPALGKVSGISGALTILADVSAANGLSLLGKYTGTTASVNASLYTSTELQSLYGNLSKLTAITVPQLVLEDTWLDTTAINELFAKSTDVGLTVSAASSTKLTGLLSQLSKVANNGIVGTLSLTKDTGVASQLQSLLAKTATGATVSVDATDMADGQLYALVESASKVDSVSNLVVPSSAWSLIGAQPVSNLGNLLGKSTEAKLSLTSATADQIKTVADHVAQYAVDGLTGSFILNSTFLLTQLEALLGNKVADGANVTVNASSMDIDQVAALFTNAAKIDVLNNLSAPSGIMARIGNNFGLLFTKGIGHAVDLTGATAAQLAVIGQFVNQYKADGLTGSFTIDKDLQSYSFAALLGDRVADAANVTIQAAGMDNDQLAAVVQGIGKVDSVLGLSLSTANVSSLSSTDLGTLLSKATDASVVMPSQIVSTQGDVLVANLTHVADGGLSGHILIGTASNTTLRAVDTKLASGNALDISGGPVDDVIDLTGFTKNTTIAMGAGANTITLGSGVDTVYIGGTSRGLSFNTANTNTNNLTKISGFQNTDVLMLSTSSLAFGNGFAFTAGTQVNRLSLTEDGTGITTIADVLAALPTPGSGAVGSTAVLAEIAVLTITGGGSFGGKTFMVINDANPVFTSADTIIELVGGLIPTITFGMPSF
ncbi:DUF4214 domain-containing protein [Pigmentiphaga aceris]|uniref:DUF4214 domain-containing protein n=1 Tax=Pigmentiphaga aceris TaxID=1940612 RepID=A0A5C0B411_9BURK|nr:DUF4214 domain-containing protein [Pigmentiphaga aceris]QEI08413.1 DUF4214 domain-containing protein [Pigmentiphaga aceris]